MGKALLAFAEKEIQRGMLATVEKVQVRVYRGGKKGAWLALV